MRAKQTAKNLLSYYHDFNLEPAEVRVVRTLSRTRDWFEPKRFITGAVILGTIVIVVLVLLFTNNLTAFYDWLIGWTTNDEAWTGIMRENPWIFWAFAAGGLARPVLFAAPGCWTAIPHHLGVHRGFYRWPCLLVAVRSPP